MGWTWQTATHFKNGKIDRKAECDAYFLEGLNASWYKVEKSSLVGTVYYAAITQLKKIENGKAIEIPEYQRETFAVVFLTSTDKTEFGYKDMTENMGPCEYDCPVSIIKLLSPTESEWAERWRNECLERHKKKLKNDTLLKELPIGSEIEVNGVTYEKVAPMAQFKTPFWFNRAKKTYIPKKRIKDYKVLKVG